MLGKDVSSSSAVQREQQKPRIRSKTGAGVFQCLVVSVSPRRRETLASTASLEGWDTVVCADVRNSRAASQRELFGLALVDLGRQNGGTPSGFCELTEQLVAMSNMLVVVCGHENDPNEEIWARRVGAWIYLPGTGPDSEASMICREAMHVARRLTDPTRKA